MHGAPWPCLVLATLVRLCSAAMEIWKAGGGSGGPGDSQLLVWQYLKQLAVQVQEEGVNIKAKKEKRIKHGMVIKFKDCGNFSGLF